MIVPYLHFQKSCRAAMLFYQNVPGDMRGSDTARAERRLCRLPHCLCRGFARNLSRSDPSRPWSPA